MCELSPLGGLKTTILPLNKKIVYLFQFLILNN